MKRTFSRARLCLLFLTLAASTILFVYEVGEKSGPAAPRQVLNPDDAATPTADEKTQAAVASPDKPSFIPDQLLVSFREGVTHGESVRAIRNLGASVLQAFDYPRGLYLVQLPEGIDVAQAESYFAHSTIAAGTEPNYLFHPSRIPDDPHFSKQWALRNVGQDGALFDMDINAPEAWAFNTGSEEFVLGVIDSGVDYSHVDLKDNIWHNPAEIPGNGIDDDGNGWVDDIHGIDTFDGDSDPLDENGHGTHVSGILAARGNNGEGVTGVMWRARIASCRFLGADGYGSTSGAIGCLNYFADLKKRGVNIVATNNSWGGFSYSEFLYQAIHAHLEEGILLIAAAGNGSCEYPQYPASYEWENIISVGATSDVTGGDFLCDGDVHAPGMNIFSTLPANTYGYASGTSMATPFVTGIIGLYKAHQPALEALELKQRLIDTALSTYPSRYPMARLKFSDEDADRDGMRDDWEQRFGLDSSSSADAAMDADEDGLTNLEEFTHGTDPRNDDTDGDGLADGDEISVYSTDPLRGDSDEDGLSDLAEVQTYQTDPNQKDSDADGLEDREEIHIHGTDPLSADSDGDGMPDGWEVAYGLDPLNAADATGDSDGDGLTNAQELLYGSAPDSVDSDGDGLADVDEIEQYGTDPALLDSDGDRLPDNWEIASGFDPLLASDARQDQDGDGYATLREYLSDSDPADVSAIPPFQNWLMRGGNTALNGFVPVEIDLPAAALRWEARHLSLDADSGIVLSPSGVLVKEHYSRGLLAFSPFSGELLWHKPLETGLGYEWRPSALSTPAISGDRIIVTQARNNPFSTSSTPPEDHPDQMIALNPGDGEELLRATLTRHTPGPADHSYAPYVAAQPLPAPVSTASHYFVKDGDTLGKFDRASGQPLWQAYVGDTSGLWSPVLANELVLGFSEGALVGFSVEDGTRQLQWYGGDCRYAGNNLVAAYKSTAVVHFGGCLFAYDLEQQRQRWSIHSSGAVALAVDDRSTYVLSGGKLHVYSLVDGTLLKTVDVFASGDAASLLVTLDYAFISGRDGTAAVNLDSGEVVWRHAEGGQVAISDDGALLINAGDSLLLSIDMQGDTDEDGLPGWWERHYGLNPFSAGDESLDADADGLVNAEEYALKTDPTVADSDADGIADGVEHNVLKTDPVNPDTDGDGLSDGSEQSYGTDGLAFDSDGDGVSDGQEVEVFGTDPLDASSRPQVSANSSESFEQGFPTHWVTPEYPVPGWGSDTQTATDGQRSLRSDWLETGEVAEMSWSQVFLPGSLSFDAKVEGETCCDILRVYLDDVLQLSIVGADWRRWTIDIPAGVHTVKWSFLRNSGEGFENSAAWIDNLVFTTKAPMAVNQSNVLVFSKSKIYEISPSGQRVGVPLSVPSIEGASDMEMLPNRRLLIAGGETFHIYDLVSGHLSSFDNPAGNMGRCASSSQSVRMQLLEKSLFFPYSQCNAGYGLAEVSTSGELLDVLFPHNRYLDVIAGPGNTLYALRSGEAWHTWGQAIEKIDLETRLITQTIHAEVPISRMFVTEAGHFYASTAGVSGLYVLDAQGRLLSHSEGGGSFTDLAVTSQGAQFVSHTFAVGKLLNGPVIEWFPANLIGQTRPPYSPTAIASIRVDGDDRDNDGMPDWWEVTYGLDPTEGSDAGEDLDGDGLANVDEFAAGSNPLEADSDLDGLTDTAEVKTYGTSAVDVDSDGDGLSDGEEVSNYGTDPTKSDSDADGVDDFAEIHTHGTSPVQADSDGDGASDGWELRYALDPLHAEDASSDLDDDGLNSLQEYNAGTDPTAADSDFDGLRDDEEVLITGTSALTRDSDGDMLSDAWEVAFDLDPLDPSDADGDHDGDGHSNAREYFNSTSPLDNKDFPAPQPWSTTGGDSRHRGYVPLALNSEDFDERWSVARISGDKLEVPNQIKIARGRVFVSERNTYSDIVDVSVMARDAVDGGVFWRHEFGESWPAQDISLGEDTLGFYASNRDWETAYHAINMVTGERKSIVPETVTRLSGSAPLTYFDGSFYSFNTNSDVLSRLDAVTGEQIWSYAADLVRSSLVNPAVDKNHVYGYSAGRGLRILDRATGALVKDIPFKRLTSEPWQWLSPMIGAQDNVIAAFNLGFDGGLLASFHIPSGITEWSLAGEFRSQPAYANGVVYAVESQGLIAVDELSGEILWRWENVEAPLTGAPLVTDTHVFVSAQTEVWAIELASRQPVWRYGRGGHLSMGEDGALYIAGFDGGVSAVQVQPLDVDGDGLADWWERLHGLNPASGDDRLQDPDGDGATNWQEYTARTLPLVADTDGDGLRDGEEILTLLSHPRLPDSDQDGLSDGEEVLRYNSNPLLEDSDGDGLTDSEEVNIHGTSPTQEDTDQDGLPDAFELHAQLDPLRSDDAEEDTDGDGLNNLAEFEIGSDIRQVDTDGDGLDDGAEVHQWGTSPVSVDTDGDRMSDGRELASGTDPLDGGDAPLDFDGDGFLNIEEYFASSDLTDSNSIPEISAWRIERGSERLDSYVPLSLNPDNFSLRWKRDLDGASTTGFSNVVTDGEYAALVGFGWDSSAGGDFLAQKRVMVLDTRSGDQVWSRRFDSFNTLGAPAIEDGVIYLASQGVDRLLGLDVKTGDDRLNVHFQTESHFWYNRPPVPFADTLYVEGHNRGLVAFDVHKGEEKLRYPERTRSQLTPVDEKYVYHLSGGSSFPLTLTVLERDTLAVAFTIDSGIENFYRTPNFTPLLTRSGKLILVHAGQAVAFDLASRSVAWHKVLPDVPAWYFSKKYEDYFAHANGVLYLIHDGNLLALSEDDGRELWRWNKQDFDISRNIVVTNDHLFTGTWQKTLAISLATHEVVWSYPIGGALSLDNNGSLYIVAEDGSVHAINIEGDTDNDGMPDWWERNYHLNPRDATDIHSDSDNDGLSALEEYQWLASPLQSDSDADGLEDGLEVRAGSDPARADSDDDGLSDGEEVHTYGSDPTSADSDGDGLADGDEVFRFHSDPINADSDGDGLSDGIEVGVGLNPASAVDANADMDSDGLTNLEEFQLGSKLDVLDSDGDGIGDKQEFTEFSTSPLAADTDGDRMPDLWEIDYGLDPLSPSSQDSDQDVDGYPDLVEFAAGTNPTDAGSMPAVTPWTGLGGNSGHTGFVPVVIDPDNLDQGWKVRVLDNFYHPASAPVARDGAVYVSHRGPNKRQYVSAFDAVSGVRKWQKFLGYGDAVSPPAVGETGLWMFVEGQGILGLDPDNGETTTSAFEYLEPTVYTAPTIAGDMLFGYSNVPSGVALAFNQGRLFGLDLTSGEVTWRRNRLAWGGWSPAVDDRYLFEYSPLSHHEFAVTDRVSGKKHLVIHDQSASPAPFDQGVSPVRTLSGAVLVQGGRLVSFDLDCRCKKWELPDQYQGQPVYAPGKVFAINGSAVVSVDERSGIELARYTFPGETLAGELLVTLSHLIVSTDVRVVAVNLISGVEEWQYPVAGRLALGNDQKLIIATANGDLVGLHLQPDGDADGIPDSWELANGLNANDPSDAYGDADGDSLLNLVEFYLSANPASADSDGDGVSDGEERLAGTGLHTPDSDRDGLRDGWELLEAGTSALHRDSDEDGLEDRHELELYASNPLLADTDADGFDDYWEVRELSKPASPSVHPAPQDYSVISFEQGRLPPGWSQVAGAENGWIAARGSASDGEFALHAMPHNIISITDYEERSSIQWHANFPAGSLLFDFFDPQFISRADLSVYIDNENVLEFEALNKTWSTYYVSLTEGRHEVRWEYALNSSANFRELTLAVMDNVRVQPLGFDTDGDGMPDTWEIDHRLNMDYPGDAQEDPDGDGVSNLEEFRNGTDPNTPDLESGSSSSSGGSGSSSSSGSSSGSGVGSSGTGSSGGSSGAAGGGGGGSGGSVSLELLILMLLIAIAVRRPHWLLVGRRFFPGRGPGSRICRLS